MVSDRDFDQDPYDDDDSVIQVPPQFRDLQATDRKVTVSQLSDMYARGRLNLQPEFQREYVWDEKRASRFIESILLNLPVPPIFVAENEDGSWEVVDGHQRLQSLFGFLRKLPGDAAKGRFVPATFRALRLKGLEVLEELNGRGIELLPAEQLSLLMDRRLTIISIPKKADSDLRFVLFERLNLGSVPLNAQELRNCIYRGPYNDLIRELAAESRTLSLFGRKSAGKRMKERELVVRFFALLHRRTQYRVPFTMFLNEEMDEHRDASLEDIQRYRWEFSQGLEWTRKIFRQESCLAFRPGDQADTKGQWQSWNELIYEVQMVSSAEFAEELTKVAMTLGTQTELFLEGLRSRLIDVMCSSRFREAGSAFTRSPENTGRRFSAWSDAMSSAIQSPERMIEEARRIRHLLQASPLCNRCFQSIGSVDDARPQPDEDKAVHRACFQLWASEMEATRRAELIKR